MELSEDITSRCTKTPFWTPERRWFLQFFVGILICLSNGACFCFGVFSPFMKRGKFKYNQSQVNWVSTIGVIMSYFSLPTGFLYDSKGPMMTLLVGTALNVFGWIGMFLIFQSEESPLLGTSLFTMCVFYGISQFSASFFETGSILTNLEAFSCYQGRVILIQKTFMGLGSSVIVQIYIAFFETRFSWIGPFFLFLAIYSLCAGVLGTIFVRLPTEETRCVGLNVPDEEVIEKGGGESTLFRTPFNLGSAILLISIVFFTTVTLLENYHLVTDSGRIMIGICTIILCASFALMIVVTPNYSLTSRNDFTVCDQKESSEENIKMSVCQEPETNDNGFGAVRKTSDSSRECRNFQLNEKYVGLETSLTRELRYSDGDIPADMEGPAVKGWSFPTGNNFPVNLEEGGQVFKLNSESLWCNVQKREFWLMWAVCFASWSSATLISSNSSQIYESLDFTGYSSSVNAVFVSIYGVASAIGRVGVGAIHPSLVKKKIHISVLFTVAPLLNVVGLILFLFMPPKALVVPYFWVGLATGVSWGSTVLIIKGLFSPENCGKHYNFLYTAGIVSPLFFNVALFGPIYDYHSRKQGHWATRQCEGLSCIWIPLAVCAMVNACAFPLAVYFMVRVKGRGGF